MKFHELDVGSRFFDPYSGERFVKLCGNAAAWNDSGDSNDEKGIVTFNPEEEIEEIAK